MIDKKGSPYFDFLKKLWIHPYTLFFTLSFFIYARGLSYLPFIFDDGVQIFNNPFMKDSVFYYFTHSLTPIPFLIWKGIITLFGAKQTFIFRLINIALHSFNGYLIWKISKQYFSQDRLGEAAPYLIAIIFLLHPVQVEAVVWISSMRTLLGGSFALLSLNFFLSYTHLSEHSEQKSGQLILSYICTFMIIFTYPPMIAMVLTYPFFLALKGNTVPEILALRRDKNFIISSALLVLFLVLTFLMHQSNILSKSFAIVSLKVYLELIFTSLGQYTINTVLPFQLFFDYQINPLTLNFLKEDFQTNHAFYAGLMMILTFMAFILGKKSRQMGLLLLLFIIFLLPNLGIIHHDFHNLSTVSDRYLYLSLFPYALLLVRGIFSLKDRLKNAQFLGPDMIVLVVIALLSLLSIKQVGRWKDPKSFLASSTPKAQLSSPLLISLGNLYKDNGHLNEAATYFLEVLASDPYNLGAFDALIDLFFKDPNQKSAERVVGLLERRLIYPTEQQLVPLAKIYFFLKEFNKAQDLAKQSLSLNIKNEQAIEIIDSAANAEKLTLREHLETLFNIYYSTNQMELAQKLNAELLKLYPRNSDYLEKRDLILKESSPQ